MKQAGDYVVEKDGMVAEPVVKYGRRTKKWEQQSIAYVIRKGAVQRPFAQEAELLEKSARLAELNTALDYLIKVRGMDFVSAVETLCGERGAAVRRSPAELQGQKKVKPFLLPRENRCGTAAVTYLLGRGIDAEVINRCIGKGILYESRDHHNCVFVGKDSAGKARYACQRGIYGTFKNDVDRSDKRYSFSFPSVDKDSPFVAVAESPIDALSIASLLKMQGEDWTKNHCLSLGGTAPRALLTFLHDHPAVTCISLCLDNDRAGLLGMEKIREAVREDTELSRRIRVIVDNPPPCSYGKDYNELLQKTAARYGAGNKEKVKPDYRMER